MDFHPPFYAQLAERKMLPGQPARVRGIIMDFHEKGRS